MKNFGELGRRFDEGDVAGRHAEIVLPGCPFELHLQLVRQCAGCIPFADSQEGRCGFGALLETEEDATAGDGIPMDVGRNGHAQTAIEFFWLEKAGELLGEA